MQIMQPKNSIALWWMMRTSRPSVVSGKGTSAGVNTASTRNDKPYPSRP